MSNLETDNSLVILSFLVCGIIKKSMRFTVPQFIETETKIIGPLTWRQFIYIGTAGGISFIFYLYFGKTNFFLFFIIATALILGALALSFLQISGQSLPTFFKNLLMFFISPKIYLWRRKAVPPKTARKKPKKPALEVAETHIPKIGESRLKKLSTQIETKTK